MSGFFDKKETQSIERPDGKSRTCVSCGLLQTARNPRMKPVGNNRKRIMNILAVPNSKEDAKGELLFGQEGRALQNEYQKLGIDIYEDCITITAIQCHTTSPDSYHVDCCRKTVLKYIEQYKPAVVLCFGVEALLSVIGHKYPQDFESMKKWRGWTIPDQEIKAWVCPMNVLADVSSTPALLTGWRNDFENALNCLSVIFRAFKEPEVRIVSNIAEVDIRGDCAAFDYETTGIKPHAKGHRIVCASIADNPKYGYAFMMPQTPKERKPFVDFLTNPLIMKIAQNMKYEHTWSLVRLKCEVQHWFHDTMLMTHILDNRVGITGLKFQAYVQFGVLDYASDVSSYLQSGSKDGNALNNIMELVSTESGRNKLLKYCCWDSVLEYRLWQLQQERLDELTDLPF